MYEQPARELTVAWKVRINATLAARVDLANWDASLQKPKYGSRKQLIEALLRGWLAETSANVEDQPQKDIV